MDEKLAEIFRSIGIDKGEFYINDNGKIMKKSFPLDDYTGYFINEKGWFMKEDFPLSSPTGYALNQNNEFVKQGIFDEPTGYYISSDGTIKKRAFLIDDDTGYKFTKDNRLVKKAFGPNEPHVDFTGERQLNESDEGNFFVKILVYIFLFVVAILIAIYLIIIAAALAPLGLLIYYAITKKVENGWLLAGGLLSFYWVLDNLKGWILRGNFGLDAELSRFLALVYAVVGVILLIIYLNNVQKKRFSA